MTRRARAVGAGLLVAVVVLSASCSPRVALPPPPRFSTLTASQLRELACLRPGEATRADVVRVAGEPTGGWEEPTREEFARSPHRPMVDSLFPAARVILASLPEGPPGQARMMYAAPPSGAGVSAVLVFLLDGRYTGYVRIDLSDPGSGGVSGVGEGSLLSPAALAAAKGLIEQGADARGLLDALGPPAAVAPPEHLFLPLEAGARWMYRFRPPAAVTGVGIEELTLVWSVSPGSGALSFYGASPGFPGFANHMLLALGMLSAGAGGVAERQLDALAAVADRYRRELSEQLRSETPVRSGPRFERVARVSARVLRSAPRHIRSVRVHVSESAAVNAAAWRERDGQLHMKVNVGLLEKVRDDDQLAAVLCHELGHITEQHVVIPLGYLRRHAGELEPVFLAWGQMLEHDADLRGQEMLAAAGYRAGAADEVLRMLGDVAPPAADVPGTHPSIESRRKLLTWYRGFRWERAAAPR